MSSSSHKINEESPEDDADNDDIVVSSDGPSRHEQKRQRFANVKRNTFLLNVKHFTDKILRNPEMWRRDDLGFLRSFVDKIRNDQVHFPPSVASRQCAPEAHISDKWAHRLSKHFVQGVYSRAIFSQNDCDPEHLPIVVVTNVEQKHVTINLRGRSNQEKRFTMHVADGDNNILTVKGASQLNATMGRLEVGSVVRLITFTAVYFQSGSDGPEKVALLLCDYDFVGTMEIDSKLEGRPKSRLEVVRMSSQEASVYTDDIDTGTDASHSTVTESNTTAGTDASHLTVTESNTMFEQENCTLEHRLCSMNGVHFVICITHAFPVERLDLIALANEYPFVTMPVSEMDNSRKRSMIYWWYMVNVYSVTGKGHREPPPMCLVQRVRELYPNRPGVTYKGYLSS
jgi:hypothetical protein